MLLVMMKMLEGVYVVRLSVGTKRLHLDACAVCSCNCRPFQRYSGYAGNDPGLYLFISFRRSWPRRWRSRPGRVSCAYNYDRDHKLVRSQISPTMTDQSTSSALIFGATG